MSQTNPHLKPMRQTPAVGTEYYVVFAKTPGTPKKRVWSGDSLDKSFLRRGLCHLTASAAIEAEQAMLAARTKGGDTDGGQTPRLEAINEAGEVRAVMTFDDVPLVISVVRTLAEWVEADPSRRLRWGAAPAADVLLSSSDLREMRARGDGRFDQDAPAAPDMPPEFWEMAAFFRANDHIGRFDWKLVAKAAGKHGIRYRTNTALEQFLSDIVGPPAPVALVEPDPDGSDPLREAYRHGFNADRDLWGEQWVNAREKALAPLTAAPAAPAPEPVAWIWELDSRQGLTFDGERTPDYATTTPLFAAPPAPVAASAVAWAVERWNDEVKHRPLRNIHRRSLDGTWRQVIRHFGGDPNALIGPSHDDLVAANPSDAVCDPVADYPAGDQSEARWPPKDSSIRYRNWRGEVAVRTIVPLRIWYGATEWHPEPQLLLRAWDADKRGVRDFALADFLPPAGEPIPLVEKREPSCLVIINKTAAVGKTDQLLHFVTMSRGAADVFAERRRQVAEEGWTPEHDDKHVNGELALAGAAYAGYASARAEVDLSLGAKAVNLLWPWGSAWWKPSSMRRNLVKAGALIIAEIERLDRAAARDAEGDANG